MRLTPQDYPLSMTIGEVAAYEEEGRVLQARRPRHPGVDAPVRWPMSSHGLATLDHLARPPRQLASEALRQA